MTLLFEPDPDVAARIVAAFGPGSEIRVVDDLGSASRAVAVEPAPCILVLGPTPRLIEALAFADEARSIRPAVSTVMVRDELDVSELTGAIRAGVRDVVRTDDVRGLLGAVNRLVNPPKHAERVELDIAEDGPLATVGQGTVIALFAAKGGSGKTTVATNLAVALNRKGARRVCLVDLDVAFGDVAMMLGLAPRRTLADAVEFHGGLDDGRLAQLITPYAKGFDCVLAPTNPSDGDHVTAELVTALLTILRARYDYVVVDTPGQFSEQVLAVLDVADHHLLPITAESTALKSLRVTLDLLDALSYKPDLRGLVINAADAKGALKQADLERVAELPAMAALPSSPDVLAAVNKGLPLTAENDKHPYAVAVRALADSLAGEQAQPAKAKGRSWRRRG
ncbi:MAG: AAA family ATPase [Jatrophihabitans sp.]|uniref:AAA family ATPase n=1 Tax=Jatrophihabitans sp. TaxID=1932789 RepID=UPI003F7DBDB4